MHDTQACKQPDRQAGRRTTRPSCGPLEEDRQAGTERERGGWAVGGGGGKERGCMCACLCARICACIMAVKRGGSVTEHSTVPQWASMCALGRESWVQTLVPPKILPKVFAARWRLLRNAPSKEHHSRYITLFFEGTYSVISFYELLGVSLAALMHFLRQFWRNLSLFPWSY